MYNEIQYNNLKNISLLYNENNVLIIILYFYWDKSTIKKISNACMWLSRMKEFKISMEILILSVINILTNLWSKSIDDKNVEVKIIE